MQQLRREHPLYEQIYQVLEQAILEGEFASGERLIDTKVAQDFGVSRSPVREAFRKLESNGLLVNREGIIMVVSPSLEDVLELYQVRVGLESVAAYWAAQHMTAEELKRLQSLLKESEKATQQKDLTNIICLNTQFHESIIYSSGNLRLRAMMSNIHSLIRLFRSTIIKQYNRGDSFLLEHYAIFQALINRDPEKAAKAMETHIYHDMEHFRHFYLKTKKTIHRRSEG
ncbi:GntR family transcriptional regulator [Ammoniphilus sp. YIM 78166]|uniref:GntR family transcriptional regulator n=1 Tax=Ammoniphilus sp. YIM 78166 TaxID=1644106 RepID=UPI0010703DD3|nr:GntR family transcriptional regulator [Ammoniphilus sp. YIM 78166]